ncbi:MAG: class I SAM-dependent methyltransferase [Rickettsiaceae bacterium]|nr:class I SAM-dependent methyltransferase [Rickettsiaceae bacterium]
MNITIYNGRDNFIKALPKNAITAEIGVSACENAIRIINKSQPKELHLIDVWQDFTTKGGDYKVRSQSAWEQCYRRAKSLEETPGVKVHRLFSVDAAKLFPNHYFDWVYIDAGHSYESCISDLECWYPKVKVGGFLAGHDYSNDPSILDKGIDVKRAVDDFCAKYKLTISFLSDCAKCEDYAIELR